MPIRVAFRRLHTVLVVQNGDIPVIGCSVMAIDGRRGRVADLTPSEVSIKWDLIGLRTYESVIYDHII